MSFVLTSSEQFEHDRNRPKGARGPACHAPTNSLYLGIGGMITACCVNRTYLLGRYPEQSLMDAWIGVKRSELEHAIATGDLSKGCQVCYQAIRSGNYAGLSARVYDQFEKPRSGYPKKIDFELSNKCNLECIMCRGERSSAIRRNREHLPPIEMPYDAAFLQQLEEFIPHLEDAHFLGGEPFMIPIYQEIWASMVRLNPKIEISVQTNATLLTDRVKDLLERMRFSIAVSIDAIEPELFAAIRINGKFEEVAANIDYLRDYCARKGTAISLSYTPMTRNWHELPEVVRWCNARKLPLFFNTLSYPRKLALKELPAETLGSMLGFLEEAKHDARTPLEMSNREAYLNMVQLVRYWHREALARQEKNDHLIAEDLDAYFELFNAYLASQVEESRRISTYESVRGKLERLLTTVESLGKYEALHDHLLTVDFATLLRYVPESTEAELLAGLQGVLPD